MIIEQSRSIVKEVGKALVGKQEVIEKALMAVYAGGHVLLEDYPGVGKTTLALALSKALDLDFKRIQFTPDTMPSDIMGFSLYDKDAGSFRFTMGAVNCNLLLGDEINRTSAKTQSALLEVMEEMAVTFSGLTSTLEDTMTEIDNARGEGYNAERSGGLQAEIDAYGGALGQAVESLNAIAGQNEAYLENLSEQYTREALSAVLLGETPSGIYGPEQQEELAAMREEYQAASEAYASGSQEAGLKMDSLRREAEGLAKAAYESSEQYQSVHDTELDLISAIRENTAALSGWRNEYETQQAMTKGSLVNLIGENSLVGQAMGFFSGASALVGTGSETTTGLSVEERQAGNWRRGGYYDEDGVWRSHAAGLERVPYDGYAALLHEGERVLTAREARQADQGGGAQVTITGNTFQVRQESDIDAIAEALYRKLRLAQMGGVR